MIITPAEISDLKFNAQIMRKAIEIILEYNHDNMDEFAMLEIAEFFEPWRPGQNYGNNTVLKYGVDNNGRAVLYVTTRNVNSTENATPDKTPNSYAKMVP